MARKQKDTRREGTDEESIWARLNEEWDALQEELRRTSELREGESLAPPSKLAARKAEAKKFMEFIILPPKQLGGHKPISIKDVIRGVKKTIKTRGRTGR